VLLRTHNIIKALSTNISRSFSQVEALCYVAVKNDQVIMIINDTDIKKFYIINLKGQTIIDLFLSEVNNLLYSADTES